MAETRGRQKPAGEPAQPAQEETAAGEPGPAVNVDTGAVSAAGEPLPPADAEVTGDPDPEWLALLDRARAGGEDAARAVIDAYRRGVMVGIDRAGQQPAAAGVTSQDVAALRGVVASGRPRSMPRRVILSEGVRHDLEQLGRVTDPGTGYELRRDEGGRVTVHQRGTGNPVAGVTVVGPDQSPQNA